MIPEKHCIRNWQNIMQNRPQLFCFAHVGGNASFFDEIEKDMGGIDVVKLEYSGHGSRHKEGLYGNFDELADDVFKNMKDRYSGGDYGLFGYSMGTIALAEVLKRILAVSDMKLPSRVFLAAHEPHTKSELLGFQDDELDAWVKDRTIKFGGVPEKLLHNKAFWRMYLPLYRADYTLIGKYRFEKLDLKTEIPATVFYSETDTPLTDMEQWTNYFTGACEYHRFDGTHFFIQEHHREMAEIIRERLGVRS